MTLFIFLINYERYVERAVRLVTGLKAPLISYIYMYVCMYVYHAHSSFCELDALTHQSMRDAEEVYAGPTGCR